jgi:hypothetical protein
VGEPWPFTRASVDSLAPLAPLFFLRGRRRLFLFGASGSGALLMDAFFSATLSGPPLEGPLAWVVPALGELVCHGRNMGSIFRARYPHSGRRFFPHLCVSGAAARSRPGWPALTPGAAAAGHCRLSLPIRANSAKRITTSKRPVQEKPRYAGSTGASQAACSKIRGAEVEQPHRGTDFCPP